MAPLLFAGFGIGFIALTVTQNGIDVVPDSIGWGLFAYGMSRLARRSRLFVVTAALSAVNAVIALVNFLPRALPDTVDDVVVFVYNVLSNLTLALAATAIADAAKPDDPGTARHFRLMSVIFGSTLVAFVTGWIVFSTDEDAGTTIVGFGSLAFVLTMIWLLVMLVLRADREYVSAVEPVRRTPTQANPPRSRSGNPAKRAASSHPPSQQRPKRRPRRT
jgi:hypothetical protein